MCINRRTHRWRSSTPSADNAAASQNIKWKVPDNNRKAVKQKRAIEEEHLKYLTVVTTYFVSTFN